MSRELARRSSEDDGKVVHVLVSPGITATKMAAELLRPVILEWLMLLFFYFVRCVESQFDMCISDIRAAVPPTRLAARPLLNVQGGHRRVEPHASPD